MRDADFGGTKRRHQNFNQLHKHKMSEPDLFPEIVRDIPDCGGKPPEWPYFLVAFWPRGGYWRIFEQTYSAPDCDAINSDARELRRRGWARVKVLKLPEGIEK